MAKKKKKEKKSLLDQVSDSTKNVGLSPEQVAAEVFNKEIQPPALTKQEMGRTVLNLEGLAGRGEGVRLKREEEAREKAKEAGEAQVALLPGNVASQLEEINQAEKLLTGQSPILEEPQPLNTPIPEEEPTMSPPESKQEPKSKRLIDFSPKDVQKQVREESGEQGVLDSFKGALTFFMPTLIGALGGGLLEGTEGAIAGAEAATELAASKREYDMKMGELAKANKDFTSFVDSVSGKPVILNEKTGTFRTLDGAVIDPSRVTGATTFRQSKSLVQREIEAGGKQRRFDISQSKLSGDQVETLQGFDEVQGSISRMKDLLNKRDVKTGEVIGRFQSFQEFLDAAPENFTALKSEASDAIAKYTKFISGAQVSESEAQRLGGIIPKVTDGPRRFEVKLRQFSKIMSDNREAFLRAIESGQPMKKGTIKGIREAEQAINKIQSSASQGRDRLRTSSAKSRSKGRKSYIDAINAAKSIDEINEIKKQYGARNE